MSIRSIGNAAVLRMLDSPAHRMFSGAVATIEYEGKRSGQPRRLPVQYALLGDQIVVCPAHHQSKQWWRNFEDPHPAIVTVARRPRRVIGKVVRAGDAADPAMTSYLRRFPKARDLELLVVFTPTAPETLSSLGAARPH